MKKFLALLLTSVLLLISTTMMVSAEEYQGSFIGGETLAETDISYRVYSTYSVTVPATLDHGYTMDIVVDMSNVEPGYCVDGTITNCDGNGLIKLQNEIGSEAEVFLLFNGEHYNRHDSPVFHSFTLNGMTESCSVSYDCSFAPTNAGTYTGVICFRFECRELGV